MRLFLWLFIICHGEKVFFENILLDRLFNGKRLSIVGHDNFNCIASEWLENPDNVPSLCLEYVEDETATYSSLVRPTFDVSKSIEIEFETSLVQIVEVNEHDQFMVSLHSTRISWTDQFLTWRPDMNGNITEIVIPASSVWLPDIYLWNSVFDEFNSFYDGNVILDHLGNVVWLRPGVLKSACPVNMRHFPFDVQVWLRIIIFHKVDTI